MATRQGWRPLLVPAGLVLLLAVVLLGLLPRTRPGAAAPQAPGDSAASANATVGDADRPTGSTTPSWSGGPAGGPASSAGGPASPAGDPILIGAGDIASTPGGRRGNDEATALLLDQVVAANPGRVTVFTAGDNAYETGTLAEYRDVYEPTWGRHRAITRPAPGNHEYKTEGAAGYFAYFGAAAGDPATGYYADDLGSWRVYVLNTEIAHDAGTPQERWLRADLAAHPTDCALAITHHPRFSSGSHGSDLGLAGLWQSLYDAGVEIVIAGHDHNYQRFAPMTAGGAVDAVRGIREWVVGTGGRSLYDFKSPIPNTEASSTTTYGVLKLTLHPTSYDFEFLPIAGATYRDAADGIACH